MQQHAIQDIHDFMVMFFDCHFQIKPGKFGKVAVGKRVLGTEN
jgi:hypothetical protein